MRVAFREPLAKKADGFSPDSRGGCRGVYAWLTDAKAALRLANARGTARVLTMPLTHNLDGSLMTMSGLQKKIPRVQPLLEKRLPS